MVVPIERASSSVKGKKYIGNDQAIELTENYTTVKVIGNRCALKIAHNDGNVKVIGDSCQINIVSGQGSVHYVGNGGRIIIGENTDASRVTFIGNGITVSKTALNEDGTTEKTTTQAVKRTKSSTGESNCVNLRGKSCLHIGECRNVFVPLCHNHVCIRVPSVIKSTKKCWESIYTTILLYLYVLFEPHLVILYSFILLVHPYWNYVSVYTFFFTLVY